MRLLLIEDELNLARALQHGLQRQGYAVDHASDGRAGWELIRVHTYDLVILDLGLPDLDGIDLCQRIRAEQRELRILMLTARGRPADRIHGLDSGADDYLIKPFHVGELLARIRALLRRDVQAQPPLLACAHLRLDPARRRAWVAEQPLDLTARELALLEVFGRPFVAVQFVLLR